MDSINTRRRRRRKIKMLRSLALPLNGLRSSLRGFTTAAPATTNQKSLSEYFSSTTRKPREVWIENLNTVKEEKQGILELHPEVYGTMPRIDIIHQNVTWQQKFHLVRFAHTKVRSEVRGGGRKPWPQKGQGRARHGSIRSPLFRGGGISHGPRSPTSHFFMLPFYTRVHGITSALSAKLAQDDLHVVKDLGIPTADGEYIKSLIAERKWGPSVLIVDVNDIIPENLALATEHIKYINVMPAYGLNVYSMLKHDTLVMTLDAVKHIEEKILYHLHRIDGRKLGKKFRIDQQ